MYSFKEYTYIVGKEEDEKITALQSSFWYRLVLSKTCSDLDYFTPDFLLGN